MDLSLVPTEPVTLPVESVPVLVLAVLSAISALVTALVPPQKMPRAVRIVLDLIAGNWGHASNAPPAAPAPPQAANVVPPKLPRSS